MMICLIALLASDPTSWSLPASTPGLADSPTLQPRLAAGRYRLDLEVNLITHIPLLGDQKAVAITQSEIVLDEQGWATQTNTSITTRGNGYRLSAPPRSLRALPTQRYWIRVEGDAVSADPGTLTFGKDDDDHDGERGVAMELSIDALGTFTIQVESSGHSVLSGRLTPAGAAGAVTVLSNSQRIVSGLPIVVEGKATVVAARFTLTRMAPVVAR